MANPIVDDRAFQQQFEQAQATAERANQTEPRAIAAYYEPSVRMITVRLRSGASFSFPPDIAQGLADAAPPGRPCASRDYAHGRRTALGNSGHRFYRRRTTGGAIWHPKMDGEVTSTVVPGSGLNRCLLEPRYAAESADELEAMVAMAFTQCLCKRIASFGDDQAIGFSDCLLGRRQGEE